jgi:AcrR family transcriptional regulator
MKAGGCRVKFKSCSISIKIIFGGVMKASDAGHKGPDNGADKGADDAEVRSGGLRERKKLEKAQLIRDASRHLFMTRGYEATTLRDVAALADVGFGTVSAYATDKAGLLAMLFVEDLQHLPPLFGSTDFEGGLLGQIAGTFSKLYEFWARNPELSRIVLPQMEFYNSNPFTDAILKRRQQLQADLALWLAACQDAGHVIRGADCTQAAATLFSIYTSALRDWITQDRVDVEEGRARLAYLLTIPVAAIAAAAG